MIAKKIITISIIPLLIISGYIIYICPNANQNSIVKNLLGKKSSNESNGYSNFIEFNQRSLQLQHEVVQFKIIFLENDTVDVSVFMYVGYVDQIITSNYFLLTNGVKPIMKPRILSYVPERKYVIITPRIQFSIGKFWLIKMLNDRNGKHRIGSSCTDSDHFNVHAGDIWYLTLAVPTSSEKSGFNVTFKSTQHSMHFIESVRHSNLGFYAANYCQFSGNYFAIKFSFLGGCSICNINKEMTTRNGSIIDFCVAAHRKGSMLVKPPNRAEISNKNKGFMHYGYLGNVTGDWKFNFKGWSLYFRIAGMLLYIDIDPHCFFFINEP